ncbi:hypothetical protein GN958_ATG23462, partial [Phytophthora infestans]
MINFEGFGKRESTSHSKSHIGADSSGDTLYTVLDKFAVFLAFQESSKGSVLSKNSVASYFGNVKNHLLKIFPALVAVSSKRLQKIASILDKYCSKRGTDFTHQAPACTKADLRALSTTILKGAVSPDDYKDAALLNLLWYLLGRSSDTMCLVKSQVAVYPGTFNLETSASEFLLDQLPREAVGIQEANTPTGKATVSREKTESAPKAAVPGIH